MTFGLALLPELVVHPLHSALEVLQDLLLVPLPLHDRLFDPPRLLLPVFLRHVAPQDVRRVHTVLLLQQPHRCPPCAGDATDGVSGLLSWTLQREKEEKEKGNGKGKGEKAGKEERERKGVGGGQDKEKEGGEMETRGKAEEKKEEKREKKRNRKNAQEEKKQEKRTRIGALVKPLALKELDVIVLEHVLLIGGHPPRARSILCAARVRHLLEALVRHEGLDAARVDVFLRVVAPHVPRARACDRVPAHPMLKPSAGSVSCRDRKTTGVAVWRYACAVL
eukprot:2275380-Rhodomonas_salina.2